MWYSPDRLESRATLAATRVRMRVASSRGRRGSALHPFGQKDCLCNIQTTIYRVESEVLTAASMKMAVLWVAVLCSLVEVYLMFQWSFVPLSSGQWVLMVEAARTSEMSVNFYQTTQCYNTEDSHLELQTQCCSVAVILVALCLYLSQGLPS
jgi:hypothetical protein